MECGSWCIYCTAFCTSVSQPSSLPPSTDRVAARTSSILERKALYSSRHSLARSWGPTFADHLRIALQIGLRREIMGEPYFHTSLLFLSM
jgi:hypothetical protein